MNVAGQAGEVACKADDDVKPAERFGRLSLELTLAKLHKLAKVQLG